MSDGKLIACAKSAHFHSLPVNPDAIRATQIPNHNFAMILSHAAMSARHPDRIQAGIALRVTPHHDHGLIEGDVRSFTQSYQAYTHRDGS
jgi:hypothetical protein